MGEADMLIGRWLKDVAGKEFTFAATAEDWRKLLAEAARHAPMDTITICASGCTFTTTAEQLTDAEEGAAHEPEADVDG
jgi:purine nucleoside phosphorylase